MNHGTHEIFMGAMEFSIRRLLYVHRLYLAIQPFLMLSSFFVGNYTKISKNPKLFTVSALCKCMNLNKIYKIISKDKVARKLNNAM